MNSRWLWRKCGFSDFDIELLNLDGEKKSKKTF